ncbi:MAG: MG2 domain-containing protein [Rubrivivax sp.]|nr:MG2 domain-containing protein [Rubrivivax sp.]
MGVGDRVGGRVLRVWAWFRRVASVVALAAPAAALGAAVSVSPQGEVDEVRQVRVDFGAPVVPLGDPRLPAPYRVECDGRVPPGDGRWLDERRWVYDLREPLGPGARCELRPVPGWQPSSGAGPVALPGGLGFATAGPTVLVAVPPPGSPIEEDQHFLLRLNGVADRDSVARGAWCEIDGLGDRVPVRVIDGDPRERVLRAQGLAGRRGGEPRADAARWLLLACERRFGADARVRLVWGPGIQAAGRPGLATRGERRFEWPVRPRFSAEVRCEREHARADCMPLAPVVVRFSAPVPRSAALGARLVPAGGAPIAPRDDEGGGADTVEQIRFAPPLAEGAAYTLTLPAGLRDAAGRELANASAFPLAIATGPLPPLARFPGGASFGIVEAGPEAMLPVTLRHVQAELAAATTGGHFAVKRLDPATDDLTLLRWIARVERFHERRLAARDAGLPESQWFETVREPDVRGTLREVRRERRVATRELALLAAESDVRRAELPQLAGSTPRATEVLGIPLPQPGYHVVEIESRVLGESLLAERRPMFVRTGALVTQLAVHFKRGRRSGLVWVTSLDRARPVAGARVAVSDCAGRPLWSGVTGADGVARIDRGFDDDVDECLTAHGLFVTARHRDAAGRDDLAFVFSRWSRGIEPWRFGQPTSLEPVGDRRAHTVFDRTLLRAGDTLSMKHFVRDETPRGLEPTPVDALPDAVVISHLGSGDEVRLPLAWPAGARSAHGRWEVPSGARPGAYEVALEREGRRWPSGQVRVEAFRTPLVDAQLAVPRGLQVAPASLAFEAQLRLFAGGPLAAAPVRLSALLSDRTPAFAGFDDWQFGAPRAADDGRDADAEAEPDDGARLVAHNVAATTDAAGSARLRVDALPPLAGPAELLAELEFDDPNGERQAVQQRVALWPAALVVGVRPQGWTASGGRVRLAAVVLDTAGRPLRGRPLEVHGRLQRVVSARQRVVGGFYAYENRRETVDLGPLCSGRSDAAGRIECEAAVDVTGEVELVARARDDAGRLAQAAASVWVTGAGAQWFAQDNDDRIEVVPERRRLEPGETARLQVRMPFDEALALVSVEREGVLAHRTVVLRGRRPVVEVPIPAPPRGPGPAEAAPSWAPNAYVSVLVVRGRLREVPWWSAFTWGWRDPGGWWRAFRHEGREWRAPTATVDLARPAFRMGVAALEVGLAAHRLDVQVLPDRREAGVRETVRTRVRVTHRGRPAADAEVAFAAVDEGLLALMPNPSWDLLQGLFRPRPWGVETATAMGEVIGRRHYGRKALAPGGGSGGGAAADGRRLFAPLLLWRGTVTLDARGEAWVDVPLGDTLGAFRLVAVADAGADRFGSGSATVRVTQALQAFSGLPALARDGDRLDAAFTLRNATPAAMTVTASLAGRATVDGRTVSIGTTPRRVDLAEGASVEQHWPVDLPAGAAQVEWTLDAQAEGARDRLVVVLPVAPAVPATVWQSTLQRLDAPLALPLAMPADARPGSVVVEAALRPRLGGGLPGLRRRLEADDLAGLEARASRAIGLRDIAAWVRLGAEIAAHLDADGLASHFPALPEDGARGSDGLTAHLLAIAHEAGLAWPAAVQESMLQGLAAFVEGRIERGGPAYGERADAADLRRLAAIEALSRHGRARARMLDAIEIAPARWPASALLDWWSILRRVEGIPGQAAHLADVQRRLRARLVAAGGALALAGDAGDDLPMRPAGADGDAARLLLAALDAGAAWRADAPALLAGLLARQRAGAWSTTAANAWAALALDRFGRAFEAAPVDGRSVVAVGGVARGVDWTAAAADAPLRWPLEGPARLEARHDGSGAPWLALQAIAAVPLREPVAAGLRVARTVTAIERRRPDRWSRGDLLRVRLEIEAPADRAWVVLTDPLPAGAMVLGSGLGGDSARALRGQRREGTAWLAFEERAPAHWRAYYEWMPRGRHAIEYTLRLNASGRFAMPPTRAEAMYAPGQFAALPNVPLEVER